MFAGGSDKTITAYVHNNGSLKKQWSITVESPPRSIDLHDNKILMGFKNGNVSVLNYSENVTDAPRPIMYSHCDGECWGLEICELEDGSTRIITSADDNRILAFNPQSKHVLCQGTVKIEVPGKEKKKKKADKGGYKGGASSMSSQPADCQSRCVAYCP